VLKGAHTFITNGVEHYFNSTGNVGMATAGSGDVLTGIITSLRCQGYSAIESALIGVYVHGLAGDIALEQQSAASLIATDIIGNLGKAFKKMLKTK
jgi:NAD(P)H-hydrate repair Nnr-like enzyme with NAD(P)H-hydrate dehydratase domain